MVGAIGDDLRMDYTALGDTTNLAARMESKAKPGAVLVSTNTYRKVSQQFEFKSLGVIEVKGKEKPVVIFEVIARRGSEGDTQENQRLADQFAEGLRLYRLQQWDEALALFTALGDDPASRVFAERCNHLKTEPPGDGWDGVWTMTTK